MKVECSEFLIFYEEMGVSSVCESETFGRFASKYEILGMFTRINIEDFGIIDILQYVD